MATVIPAPQPVLLPIAGSDDRFPVRRVWCVARNYAAHAREMGFDERELPFYFSKPTDAVVPVTAGTPYRLPYPPLTDNLHYEGELVIAIGTGGANIARDAALNHVWGYAVGLDMTRRDQQFALRDKGRPWEMAKAFDQSAPIGPLYPAAQAGNPGDARIWLTVDGEARQDSRTAMMIWSAAEVIADLSGYVALAPGDLIYTGTPEGVGAVTPGNRIETGIDALGSITVDIVTG